MVTMITNLDFALVAEECGRALVPDPLVEQILQFQVGRQNREEEAKQLERQRRYAEAAAVYLKELQEKPTARACAEFGLAASAFSARTNRIRARV